jgi:peptide/nickel transport system permease protein
MLEAGVLTIGVIYTAANLIADALYVVLNPRLRVRNAQ